jgi:hypothetical protein
VLAPICDQGLWLLYVFRNDADDGYLSQVNSTTIGIAKRQIKKDAAP